jgi:hypothetical protein
MDRFPLEAGPFVCIKNPIYLGGVFIQLINFALHAVGKLLSVRSLNLTSAHRTCNPPAIMSVTWHCRTVFCFISAAFFHFPTIHIEQLLLKVIKVSQ